jgi:hypothetical protein
MPRLFKTQSANCLCPLFNELITHTLQAILVFLLKPYTFTPAIFTGPFCRTIQAWGYYGFLPKTKLSSAQNKNQYQGDNVRNYHAKLSAVLETFRIASERLRNVTLPIGAGEMLTVDIKTCILYII